MQKLIYCQQCKSEGITNRCFITGYDSKCGHDVGWAYEYNKKGDYITCNLCKDSKNKCYITGYDYKCGHDNGWAMLPKNAACFGCGKTLSGKWSMENNPANNYYLNTATGRYLGISDGYFLYGGKPDWVYSYCKTCWIQEIKKILPELGIDVTKKEESNSQSKKDDAYQIENEKLKSELAKANKIIENMKNIQIDNNEINKLREEIQLLKNQLKLKNDEINDLKCKLKEELREKPKYELNEILVVNFISTDYSIHEGIKCLATDSFAEVEENLYKKYDHLRNTNNMFTANAKPILRFRTMKENNIKDGDKIQMFKLE